MEQGRVVNKLVTGALGCCMIASVVIGGCGSDKEQSAATTAYDIQISHAITGSGEPLLMIMGYGSTKDMWDPRLMQALSAKYKVITFDNRGMGETPAGTRPFTIEQFATDAEHLLDQLGIPKAHVFGWSLGGDVAMQLAVTRAERLKGLVLYASHCDGGKMFPPSDAVIDVLDDQSGTAEQRGQRLLGLMFLPEWLQEHGQELGEIFKNVRESSDAANIAKQSDALQQWKGVCAELTGLQTPTLVLSGDSDLIVPVDNAKYIATQIPKASSLIVPKAGHGLMYQEPVTVSDAVLSFLMQAE